MEVRNDRCRIGINLKGAYGSSGKEGVYAVRRKEDGLEKLRLGEMVLRMGNGEFSYTSEEGRIGGSACRLGDLCGLYIGGSTRERFYFTGWDDRPVNLEELIAAEAEAEAAVGLEPEIVQVSSENAAQSEAEEKEIAEEETGEAVIPEVDSQTASEKSVGETEGVRVAECPPKRCPFFAKKQHLAEDPAEPLAGDAEQTAWELLCRVYPKMLSAPGQEAWELLEIHLQDIGRLPRKNWIYGNNSFLIQGYYRYGHLMLARRESGGKTGYWLGVPGSRDDTERLLASMFGFREYVPGNRRRSENFGYWCTEIPLEGDGFSVYSSMQKTCQ